MAPGECGVCGAGGPIVVRPGNVHAEWCERIAAWTRAEAETLAATPRGERAAEGGGRPGEVATAPVRGGE